MINKKSLGQNWLTDKGSLESIAALADLSDQDTVLEIGPGLGYLTDKLLKTNAKVIAVEYDQDLLPRLHKKYELVKRKPVLLEADIRAFDFGVLPTGYKICANIPYYLTANLMRILTDAKQKPSRAVLLVQKEVADKLTLENKRSMLNTLISYWYETSAGPVVPATYFEPAPKVDSRVLILTKKTRPLASKSDWPKFVRLVRLAYANPRKKLRTNLSAGLNISKEAVDRQLADIKIDSNNRAEQLTLTEWQRLLKL